MHNITHCMLYGGVLGYVRNKQMTPYDHDLDMMIDKKHWNSDLFKKISVSLNSEFGHQFKRVWSDTQMHVAFSETNKNSMDLWPFEIKTRDNGKKFIYIYHLENVEQDYETIFPLKFDNFSGIETFFPRDSLKYATLQYGEKAITSELTCKTIEGGNCST